MQTLIAIPTEGGNISTHFGRCDKFSIFKTQDGKIVSQQFLDPPGHEPGAYPKYLGDQDVNVVICCGLGPKAKQLFDENNIDVLVGVDTSSPTELVGKFLNGSLISGNNHCDQ